MLQKPSVTGFTLIELITVIIVLGVVSVGISGFIRTGVEIYNDVTERDQLLGESRFLVERLTRELRMAVPNSVRVRKRNSGTTHCIEFVPSEWVSFYTSLSVKPDTSKSANVIAWGDNPAGYIWKTGDFAIVYPTKTDEVYDLSLIKRIATTACSDDGANNGCSTPDSSNGTLQLTLDADFDDHSPASRLYIARKAVSYCANTEGQIYRVEDSINTRQSIYRSGTLMAENLSNDLTEVNEAPFKVYDATLTRNSLVHLLLAFERNEEIINYTHEVHFPNVP